MTIWFLPRNGIFHPTKHSYDLSYHTALFGTEFVTMKVRVETLHAILHKLSMMDIPIAGVSYIYGDNMSVINNTSKTESALKKNCIAIAYHAICKPVAMGESLTGHIRS